MWSGVFPKLFFRFGRAPRPRRNRAVSRVEGGVAVEILGVDVGPLVEEEPCRIEVAVFHSPVEGGISREVEGIDVGPLAHEEPQKPTLGPAGGEMEGGLALVEDEVGVVGLAGLPEIAHVGSQGFGGALVDQFPGDFGMGQTLGELEGLVEGGEPGTVPGLLVSPQFDQDIGKPLEALGRSDVEDGISCGIPVSDGGLGHQLRDQVGVLLEGCLEDGFSLFIDGEQAGPVLGQHR